MVDGNFSVLNHVADVVMSDIYMFDLGVSFCVLCEGHGSCIIVVELCQPSLWVTNLVHR